MRLRAMLVEPRRQRIGWILTAAVVVTPLLYAAPAGASAKTVDQLIVVRLKSPTVRAASLLKGLAASRPGLSPPTRYIVKVPAGQVKAELARLQAQPGVLSVSEAQPVHAAQVNPTNLCYAAECPADDNDTGLPGSWNQDYLKVIGAPEAWAESKGQGIRVAVLDSGVYKAHPDLAGKVGVTLNICQGDDKQCKDPPGGQAAFDANGHGTHVSGLIAGDTSLSASANQEVAGLGWSVVVDEYKVLDSQGNGNTADVDTAIYDAVAHGDRVINLSLSAGVCGPNQTGCGPDPDEQAAVEYAIAHNVVVVAAAGNDSQNVPEYPASYPGVLGVAATDIHGNVLSFSEWGAGANIAAPGEQIVSTWNDGMCGADPKQLYCVNSGTSMSAPLVSAAAALVLAHNPHLSGPQVTELLESTARPTGSGHRIAGGILDVQAALAADSQAPHRFNGYELVGSDGSVYTFGSVGAFGSLHGIHLTQPVVGMTLRTDGLGYWLVAKDGGVFSYGQSHFYGSTGNIRLNQPIVGMAPTPDNKGYWLVASDGGIFSYGDAQFHGSTGNIRLNQPIVGMAATPDGRGYWLVASDGGIFAFGDARFHGSTGAVRLNKPVVGMAATADGQGYWLVASDGGIFAFGDARFHGSTGGITLAKPVTAMATTPDGRGYWLFASDGGVFNYGDAHFWGSAAGKPIPGPIVGASS